MSRKRPCSICRRWFRPHVRVPHQRACSKAECQAARRQKKQARWRERNPDYFTARRMLERNGEEPKPEPLRLPGPLSRLPWDVAQSQFGVQGADFIGVMARLLLDDAQSQLRAYRIDSRGVRLPLPPLAAQDQIAACPP